jgi:hypothetical protein
MSGARLQDGANFKEGLGMGLAHTFRGDLSRIHHRQTDLSVVLINYKERLGEADFDGRIGHADS